MGTYSCLIEPQLLFVYANFSFGKDKFLNEILTILLVKVDRMLRKMQGTPLCENGTHLKL